MAQIKRRLKHLGIAGYEQPVVDEGVRLLAIEGPARNAGVFRRLDAAGIALFFRFRHCDLSGRGMKLLEQGRIVAIENEERALGAADGDGHAVAGELAGDPLPVGQGDALEEPNGAEEFLVFRAAGHARIAGEGGEPLGERRCEQGIKQLGGFVDLEAERGLAGDQLAQGGGTGGRVRGRNGDQPREEDSMERHWFGASSH